MEHEFLEGFRGLYGAIKSGVQCMPRGVRISANYDTKSDFSGISKCCILMPRG